MTLTPASDTEIVVRSELLGDLRLSPSDVIDFPSGMLGLPECRRFVLVPGSRDGMFWLQSAEYSTLAFLLIDPFTFIDGYSVDLLPGDVAELCAADPSDIAVLTVVTLPATRGEVPTTNLQGPIAINMRQRLAKQVVRDDRDFSVRTPVDLMQAVA